MAEKHWIYVLGGQDLRKQADLWQGNKSGKHYDVIKAKMDETPSGKLKQVKNNDILYIYTHMWVDNRHKPINQVGETKKNAIQFAMHLMNEGLDRGHKKLKVFACHSGELTSVGTVSFAKALYDAMVSHYPSIGVCGYAGEVNPGGYGGHKTAGLSPGKPLMQMQQEEWEREGLRAKSNRVCFP